MTETLFVHLGNKYKKAYSQTEDARILSMRLTKPAASWNAIGIALKRSGDSVKNRYRRIKPSDGIKKHNYG